MSEEQQISEDVQSIAKTIKDHADVDKNTGTVTISKDAYKATLPDDLTFDQVKKVYQHTEKAVAGLTLATGEIGEELLKERDDIDAVSAQMDIPRHVEMSAQYNRKTTGPKSVQDRTQVDRFGTTQVRVKTLAQNPNRGDLKKVRSHLQKRAEEIFS